MRKGLNSTYAGKVLNLWLVWFEERMPRLVFIMLGELGMVVRLRIISYLGSFNRLIV